MIENKRSKSFFLKSDNINRIQITLKSKQLLVQI